MTPEQQAALLKPFPPSQIQQLPKGGVKLDYVGHAHVTQRLLEVDPEWTWQPAAMDARGLPLLDDEGGLWIYLTVGGVVRMGYGEASGGYSHADKVKAAIGDAIRNAAMRFGVALALWQKESGDTPAPAASDVTRMAGENQIKRIKAILLDKGYKGDLELHATNIMNRTIKFDQLTYHQAMLVIEKLNSHDES